MGQAAKKVKMGATHNQEFVFTRQLILSAAKNVLAEKKVSGTRMRQVAEHAGLSLGTLHYYFSSKTSLLLSVLDDMQRFYEMRQKRLLTNDLDALEKVRLFSTQQMQLLEEMPQVEEIFLDFWGQALVDVQIQGKIRTMYSAWRRDIRLAIQQGVEQGIFDEQRSVLAPYLFVALLEGIALQYLLDKDQGDLNEIFQAVYQLIVFWLRGETEEMDWPAPAEAPPQGRKSYPSDLSDEQWAGLAAILRPAKAGGRPRTTDLREVVNALVYIAALRCPWRMLPHDFPGWQTVYSYFRQWKADGTLVQLSGVLGTDLVQRTVDL